MARKKAGKNPILDSLLDDQPTKRTRSLFLHDKNFQALQDHCEEINASAVAKKRIKPCDIIDRLIKMYLDEKIDLRE
jgi:hypothetical protein